MKEDWYGRATVALTRAIEHTYTVSPLDMAGIIGMAQTLGVYHYGYFALKNRDIQYHSPMTYPSDQSAVLEWGLDSSFTPQEKPPLAIAIIAQAGGSRKRYRLVLARKEKLHLTPRVLAALEANTRTHTLTTSGFFPCSIDREYLYGYATDGYRSPQEKFGRILVSAAGELWLRGQLAAVDDVLLRLARALTVRLAEKLAQALSSMM